MKINIKGYKIIKQIAESYREDKENSDYVIKSKVIPAQTMKAYRRNSGISSLILNLRTQRR
jgi:hypothetical protein